MIKKLKGIGEKMPYKVVLRISGIREVEVEDADSWEDAAEIAAAQVEEELLGSAEVEVVDVYED